MELVAIASATLAAVVGFGIAILTAVLTQMGKLTSIDDGVKRLNGIVDSLLTSAFSKGQISPDLEQRIIRIDEHLMRSKPRENPVSLAEIERFRGYNDKIRKGMPLNYEEYRDYRQLGERIKQQLPRKQRTDFDLLLAGVLGFVAGKALAELVRSIGQRQGE